MSPRDTLRPKGLHYRPLGKGEKKKSVDIEEMLFRIRIDSTTLPRDVAIETWVKGFEHVLVRHILPGNRNRHYHIFLDAPFNSEQACRYHVDKVSQSKGPERSVKECDPTRKDEYIQYLFNHKHGNQWRLVSSTIDTTEHQRKALEVKEDFDAQRAQSSRKKTTGPTVWELVEETVALATSRIEEDRITSEYINKVYVDSAIDVHRKHRKAFCDYSLLRVVQTALSGTTHGRQQLINNVLNRLNK